VAEQELILTNPPAQNMGESPPALASGGTFRPLPKLNTRCPNDFFRYCDDPMPWHSKTLHYKGSTRTFQALGLCKLNPAKCKHCVTLSHSRDGENPQPAVTTTTPDSKATKPLNTGDSTD